jgi:hypothetical protein
MTRLTCGCYAPSFVSPSSDLNASTSCTSRSSIAQAPPGMLAAQRTVTPPVTPQAYRVPRCSIFSAKYLILLVGAQGLEPWTR